MTNALIEKVARLMHQEGIEFSRKHPDERRLAWCPFEQLREIDRDLYRHVAEKFLKAVGK